MTTEMVLEERFVPVPGGRVWTGIYGGGDETPLLVLHGGPGTPSYYLSALARLGDDRPIVLFDQLGCGRSERPDDVSLWSVDRAVAEVDAVRWQLGLTDIYVLGHSWGGYLALAYTRAHAGRQRAMVLSSPLVSVAEWMEDAAELVSRLPPHRREMISKFEALGEFDNPAYLDATKDFYRRFFCNLEPWPPELLQTFDEMGTQPYEAMWGPSEFTQTGSLRGADLAPSLGELKLPTLWLCGSSDEVAPPRLARFAKLAGGVAHVFDGGTHCVHLEQPELYLDVVRDFLRSQDESS